MPETARTQPRRRTQPVRCVQSTLPKAVAYIRVSTEEQVNRGVSLDAQLEKIRAYCVVNGLELTDIVREEGVSAWKPFAQRPGGSALTAQLGRRGAAQHIIALKLDRLFRNAEDALSQTRAWDHSGIVLHVIDMGGSALNTASPMGRMFLTMTAAFAELERNLIAERTSTALQHKKRKAEAYGPTPYGFVREGATSAHGRGGDGQLQADAGELATLAHMRKWRIEGKTLREIAARLNKRGVATKRGGAKWHASTVGKILGNDLHNIGA